MIDGQMLYPLLAYAVMIWAVLLWRLDKITSDWATSANSKLISGMIAVVIAWFGLPIFYGIFAEPASLTVMLVLYYLLNRLLPIPMMLPIESRALMWYGGMAFWVVWSALGVIPIMGVDIYHQYFTFEHLAWHYAIFAMVFLGGFLLDKKTLIIAWGCLLVVVLSVQQSDFILDYLADFWLFLLGVWSIIRLIKQLIKMVLGKKINLP